MYAVLSLVSVAEVGRSVTPLRYLSRHVSTGEEGGGGRSTMSPKLSQAMCSRQNFTGFLFMSFAKSVVRVPLGDACRLSTKYNILLDSTVVLRTFCREIAVANSS